jgi:hypothetical protein
MSDDFVDILLDGIIEDSSEADRDAVSQGSLIKYNIIYMDNDLPVKVESAYMQAYVSVEELEKFEKERLDGKQYIIHGPKGLTDQGLDDSKINRYLLEKARSADEKVIYDSKLVHGAVKGYKYMYSSWASMFTVDRFVSCIFTKKAIPKKELKEYFKCSISEGSATKIKRNTLKSNREITCLDWGVEDE